MKDVSARERAVELGQVWAWAHSVLSVRMKRSILLCQEIHARAGVGPGEQAAVDDVGEVAFECSSGLAGCLAFGGFAGEECPGGGVVSLLDDRDPVGESGSVRCSVWGLG